MELINSLCNLIDQHGASELFLQAGQFPQLRINGELVPLGEQQITEEVLAEFGKFCGAPVDALDFNSSFQSPQGTRYQVNCFRSLQQRGAIVRPIKTAIPALENLGLPLELLISWITRPSGLILITGSADSGKSTTVASCLEWLNQNCNRYIVTIEDPIEFLFQPSKSLFTQREVGTDTASFAEGLKQALRQSPDIVFVEIRDAISAQTALQAAETGHLVLATITSSNVVDTLERFSHLSEERERKNSLQILSQQLIGILCQKLVPAQTEGRVLLLEHFENQTGTRRWIAQEKFHLIADLLAKGEHPSNLTFTKSLVSRVQTGYLAEESALGFSTNPHELKRQLRGIIATSSGALR